MFRQMMFVIVAVLIFSVGYTNANAQRKLRVEVKEVVVKEAKNNSVTLDVTWSYIEQDNLLKPSEIMVIAVFVDSKGRERKATNVIAVSHEALPTSAKVVINHEEQIVSPRDIKFVVTVAPKIKDGTSNTVAGRKEVTLRVNPTN